MDRKTATREWRNATHGTQDGVPTGRTVHAFAQRVEALAIAAADKRHAAEVKTLHDFLERYGEIGNVCVRDATGKRCSYCQCATVCTA